MINLYAKVEHPTNAYEHDKQLVAELNADEYYSIRYIEVGGSHTSVYLINDKKRYNSVNFEFYYKDEENDLYIKYDIFNDPDINIYCQPLF